MKAALFWLMVAASSGQLSACQFSLAEQQVYHRAISSSIPVAERRTSFEASLHACPDDPKLYGEFASFLIANHDFSTALLWINKGLALAPDEKTLTLRKGEALVALSDGQGALAALVMLPETGESQFFKGLAYQLLQDHRHAQDCLLDAWRRGNEDPYVLYLVIREDMELSDKAAGLEHFKIMLARFPDSAWIHILLGDAHFNKSENAEARTEYLAAVKLMPDLFEPNFRLGYIAFEAGDDMSAEQYYKRALAAKPHHTEANVYLGETLRRERRFSEAITQLRLAIAVDPEATLAYDALSKALSDSGRLTESADVLQLAENKFPDNSSFPAMRARVLSRMGRTQEAQQDAQRATDIIAAKNRKEALVP